jgi:hypothetical protein
MLWRPRPLRHRCCTVPRRRPASCWRGPGPSSAWSPPATTGSPPPAPTAVPLSTRVGVWLPDGFWCSTGSLARHNLLTNPQITVHLERGDQVVIVGSVAAAVTGTGRLQAFLAAYNAKYDWDAAGTDDGVTDSAGGRAGLPGAAAGRDLPDQRRGSDSGAVSNLSAHPPCSATRGIVWPRLLRPLSWSDAVQGVVAHGDVWGPHSLHTAEATGSKPVTPTREKHQ